LRKWAVESVLDLDQRIRGDGAASNPALDLAEQYSLCSRLQAENEGLRDCMNDAVRENETLRASIDRVSTEPENQLRLAVAGEAFENEQLHAMMDAMKEDFREREDALHAAIQTINAELVKAHATNQSVAQALQEAKRQPQVVAAPTAQDQVPTLRAELAGLVAKLGATQTELTRIRSASASQKHDFEDLLSQHLQDAELGYSMSILQLRQENAALKAIIPAKGVGLALTSACVCRLVLDCLPRREKR